MQRLFLPPVAFALGLIGVAVLPGPIVLPDLLRLSGVLPGSAGLLLLASARRSYQRRGSEIHTFREPRSLVTTGAFRISRNPMYLGLCGVLAAAALVAGTPWGWLVVIAFAGLCQGWYIPFEERAAEEAFGEPYRAYRARTPRWIDLRAPWR